MADFDVLLRSGCTLLTILEFVPLIQIYSKLPRVSKYFYEILRSGPVVRLLFSKHFGTEVGEVTSCTGFNSFVEEWYTEWYNYKTEAEQLFMARFKELQCGVLVTEDAVHIIDALTARKPFDSEMLEELHSFLKAMLSVTEFRKRWPKDLHCSSETDYGHLPIVLKIEKSEIDENSGKPEESEESKKLAKAGSAGPPTMMDLMVALKMDPLVCTRIKMDFLPTEGFTKTPLDVDSWNVMYSTHTDVKAENLYNYYSDGAYAGLFYFGTELFNPCVLVCLKEISNGWFAGSLSAAIYT